MEYSENISNTNATSQSSGVSIFLSKYKYWIFGGLIVLLIILVSLLMVNIYFNKSNVPSNNNIPTSNSANDMGKKIGEAIPRSPTNDHPIDNMSVGLVAPTPVPNASAAPPAVYADVMTASPAPTTAPPAVYAQETNGVPTPNESAAPPAVFG